MEQTCQNDDFGLKGEEILKKNIDNAINSNKCNQCDYASSYASALWIHLKMHSGKKSNKCKQCDFASSRVGDLRTHLKTHSGEKSNKCNQCDFAFSRADHLRTHLKTHSAKQVSVTMHPLKQAI